MGPIKGRRNVRKIEVLTDTLTEFELGDTASDIGRRENRERGRHRNNTERQGRGRKSGGRKPHTQQRRE